MVEKTLSQDIEETRVQWYLTHGGRESLHIHIHSCARSPLGLQEGRYREKICDFSKLLPSQLESYIHLSLRDICLPYHEGGTRDEFHLIYDYSDELYGSVCTLVNQMSASSQGSMTSDFHRVEEWI